MDHKIIGKPYSPEFRESGVGLFLEHRPAYASEVAALRVLADRLGCLPDSLRVWARQAQRDLGARPGPTSAEKARIQDLERGNRELRRANEILNHSDREARREQRGGGEDEERVREVAGREEPDGAEISTEAVREPADRREEAERWVGRVLRIADEEQEGEHREGAGDERQPQDEAEGRRGIGPTEVLRPAQDHHADEGSQDRPHRVHRAVEAEGTAAGLGVTAWTMMASRSGQRG